MLPVIGSFTTLLHACVNEQPRRLSAGLWPPPLPVLPRSLIPSFLGGLCCSPAIAFCYICPYPRATSNLLCPTMVFQSIYMCSTLFSFIYRYLSHYCNVKGFESGSVQVTTISSFTGTYIFR